MNFTSHASVAVVTDQLRMAGLVLGALESGRIHMNAAEYRSIAKAATRELGMLDSEEVVQVALRLPPALLSIVQNVLSERDSRALMPQANLRDRHSWPTVLRRLCGR